MFRNVPRHNGAEAWRRIAEPIQEGRELRQQQFQGRVLRPKAAGRVEDIPSVLEQWESDYRLFRESGGAELEDTQRRRIFIGMLPPDVAVYVTLQMKLYPTFDSLKTFVREYTIIITHQAAMKKAPPVYGIDHEGAPPGEDDGYDEDGYDREECEELPDEVLAFMDSRGIPRPSAGRRPFTPKPGARRWGNGPPRRDGPAPRRDGAPSPGGREMSCVNCGVKGHMAASCTRPKVEMGKRPCFICNKPGHLARNCPTKPAGGLPVRAITDGPLVDAPVKMVQTVLCCTTEDAEGFRPARKPVPQPGVLGDFIMQKEKQKRNNNRFQPFTTEDI